MMFFLFSLRPRPFYFLCGLGLFYFLAATAFVFILQPQVSVSVSASAHAVCALLRLHGEGRVCGAGSVAFIYPVGVIYLSGRAPFVIYPVGALFRLGCTQTCLLHIHSFFLASIFFVVRPFFFDFSASIFFVVRPICFVSAAFVTENF